VAVFANLPPIIDAITPQYVKLNEQYRFQSSANDPEAGKTGLSYELTEMPAGMTIAASGLISWNPTDAALAGKTYVVALKVTDNQGAWALRRFSITIQSAASLSFSSAASASPSSVLGTTTTLSAHGDQAGNSNAFSYQWTTVSKPGGAPNPTLATATA